jgi:hypothetical protein
VGAAWVADMDRDDVVFGELGECLVQVGIWFWLGFDRCGGLGERTLRRG